MRFKAEVTVRERVERTWPGKRLLQAALIWPMLTFAIWKLEQTDRSQHMYDCCGRELRDTHVEARLAAEIMSQVSPGCTIAVRAQLTGTGSERGVRVGSSNSADSVPLPP